ncbi:helix-turn-helix transcriptional regulator [Arthrobacter ruber]|uniref:helix-turn-helix transcriptional regulator n=1 Tax=Arthrobacter ruber TaxID=1258893 RepID=UPI000CF3B13F|nr:response regulator transcription factor [Arthrobacter ruber]
MRIAARSQNYVKVHLASKDVLTIAGLRQLLKPCSFITVIGTSADESSTMAAITAETPDVLLFSANTEADVRRVARAARAINESLKIVVLTDEALAVQLMATRQTRLEGILIAGGDCLQDIGATLRIVHHGGHVTSLHHETRSDPGPQPVSPKVAARLRSLSGRETTILREVVKGYTNAEIAKLLHVSVATIKADLARIMTTMGVFSRVELAVIAVQSGFVDVFHQSQGHLRPVASLTGREYGSPV